MGLLSALGGIAGSFFGGPIGGAIGSALGGGFETSSATSSASQAQVGAAQSGIDEQRRQFEVMRQALAPYMAAGTGGLAGQQALIGLAGPEAEQAAIQRLQSSETFKALTEQGENALLQRFAGTGGLRGGNIQAALAQFRPQLLAGLIEQQYGRLGGLATLGQNAAAGVGNVGMTTGSNIGNLFTQQGAAQAGGIMGQSQAFGSVPGVFGSILGSGTNPFSGGLSGLQAGFSGTSLGSSGFGTGLAYGNADLGAFL
jgi:hypothetical protein